LVKPNSCSIMVGTMRREQLNQDQRPGRRLERLIAVGKAALRYLLAPFDMNQVQAPAVPDERPGLLAELSSTCNMIIGLQTPLPEPTATVHPFRSAVFPHWCWEAALRRLRFADDERGDTPTSPVPKGD
jgi:hypothetical protein